MAFASILLFSTDHRLADGVARTVRLIPGCKLLRWTTLDSDALTEISRHPFALVIVHISGAITERCAKRALEVYAGDDRAGVPIIVILDEPSVFTESWVDLGAADCLCRPLDFGQLGRLVDSLTFRAREAHVTQRTRWLKVEGQPPYCCQSDQMLALAERVEMLRNRDCNILLTGETGTGKTHLAGVVHGMSNRAEHPFLVVNCAAIPPEVIESELFGHRQDAVSGAICDKPGQLEAVGFGTLLLDEIDSLPLGVQAKLLHVVEGRSYVPIGGDHLLHFQGRLMAASNQPLEMLVEQRRFRADLYFRLNVVEIEVPPLRTRLSIIPALVASYLAESARRYVRPRQFLSEEAIEELQRYSWPGNVRELHNVLERVMAYCDEPEIGARQLCEAWGGRHAPCGGSVLRPHADAADVTALSNPSLLRDVAAYHEPRHDCQSSESMRLADLLRRHSQN